MSVGTQWVLSHSGDPRALAIVDGTGPHEGHGPHYSRRSPGARTFTGVGKEIVLITDDAVWAVVLQKTPARRGTGASRGRVGSGDTNVQWVWRNMLFRNLGGVRSSDLIRAATELTYQYWLNRYGVLPDAQLRTEVNVRAIRSTNPGYCYQCAGWTKGPTKRHILHLYAPPPGVLSAAQGVLL